MKMNKSYTELCSIKNFRDKFEYLKLDNVVGEDTFGHLRMLNQRFYSSEEWRQVRMKIISRDLGCDLGDISIDEFGNLIHEIYGRIIVHHINPISADDIINHSDLLLDPENLVCVSERTHKAIHYGCYEDLLILQIDRVLNDTVPWK